jgi:hypothetical protein
MASHYATPPGCQVASHCVTIIPMSSQHANRAITPRPPEDVRAAAREAAERQETNLNAVIVAFLRWYGGLSDQHPDRPDPAS